MDNMTGLPLWASKEYCAAQIMSKMPKLFAMVFIKIVDSNLQHSRSLTPERPSTAEPAGKFSRRLGRASRGCDERQTSGVSGKIMLRFPPLVFDLPERPAISIVAPNKTLT